MRRPALAVLATVLLVLLAAGCGSGTTSLSGNESFGSKLNRLCADHNSKVKEIGEPNSVEELGAVGPQLLAAFDQTIAEVSGLSRRMRSSTADQLVSKTRELRVVLEQIIDAARKDDVTQVQALAVKADALDSEAGDLAKQLGAPACAA
jgi:hypothetical protein